MAFGIYLDSMIHHKEEQNHLETATIQLHKKDLRNSTIFFSLRISSSKLSPGMKHFGELGLLSKHDVP